MKDLRGKTAVVTGAASGIGLATAQALAAEGCDLVIADVDAGRLGRAEKDLAATGVGVRARVLDVSSRDAVRAFAEEVGAPDVLVNNAGVGHSGGILNTPLEDWDWVLSINLWGVVHGCHFFAPKMVARKAGHIVNVSSVLGFTASPDTIAYAASKFAVFGLSEAMRGELSAHGVGVSTICPGMIDTAIISGTRFRTHGDPHARREKVKAMFTKRGYPPAKVAAAIVGAIKGDRAVVPVAPEAWALWYGKRFMPGLSQRIAAVVAKAAERR
jgi:NAD(P)-dependent dehydrogenase (short-subunit alcohol dehydrogenase family)